MIILKDEMLQIMKKKDLRIKKLTEIIERLKEQLMKLEVENKKLKQQLKGEK